MVMVAATLAIGFLAGWFIFGGSGDNVVDEHQHGMAEAGEAIWTCSMHPQIRLNEPGDCPICGMDLIRLEREEEEHIDPMAIRMSPTAMRLAKVGTALVGKASPVKTVRLYGKVGIDERLVFSQSAHIAGRIEKLLVNFTGEFVNKGQTIAYIYSPELITAQKELFEAQKMEERLPQLLGAAKKKLKNWKLSERQVEEILKSRTIREQFPVQADVSGYVTKRMANPGDYIQKGKAIYEIGDLSKVWVLFDVYESDMPWIKTGDEVEFIVQPFPGEHFQGIISYLDPVVDSQTRVSKARVEVNNSDLRLKPQMFASGTVEAGLTEESNMLVVPKTAVMWTGKRSVVYVKDTSKAIGIRFSMRNVTLGPALNDSYVVEKGLLEGEEIAVHGTFSIDAAAQLAGKPSMMNPEGGPAMTGHSHGVTETPVSSKRPGETNAKPLAIDQKAKDSLQPLYSGYLTFKDALAADHLAEAQKAAENMQENLEKVNMAVFTGESRDAWKRFSSDLKHAMQHVPHTKTIQELRKAFQEISNAMIALTVSFKPFDQTMYVQHCPMADDNKGAEWLSVDREIKNPYFGKSMLACGEITTTIQ